VLYISLFSQRVTPPPCVAVSAASLMVLACTCAGRSEEATGARGTLPDREHHIIGGLGRCVTASSIRTAGGAAARVCY